MSVEKDLCRYPRPFCLRKPIGKKKMTNKCYSDVVGYKDKYIIKDRIQEIFEGNKNKEYEEVTNKVQREENCYSFETAWITIVGDINLQLNDILEKLNDKKNGKVEEEEERPASVRPASVRPVSVRPVSVRPASEEPIGGGEPPINFKTIIDTIITNTETKWGIKITENGNIEKACTEENNETDCTKATTLLTGLNKISELPGFINMSKILSGVGEQVKEHPEEAEHAGETINKIITSVPQDLVGECIKSIEQLKDFFDLTKYVMNNVNQLDNSDEINEKIKKIEIFFEEFEKILHPKEPSSGGTRNKKRKLKKNTKKYKKVTKRKRKSNKKKNNYNKKTKKNYRGGSLKDWLLFNGAGMSIFFSAFLTVGFVVGTAATAAFPPLLGVLALAAIMYGIYKFTSYRNDLRKMIDDPAYNPYIDPNNEANKLPKRKDKLRIEGEKEEEKYIKKYIFTKENLELFKENNMFINKPSLEEIKTWFKTQTEYFYRDNSNALEKGCESISETNENLSKIKLVCNTIKPLKITEKKNQRSPRQSLGMNLKDVEIKEDTHKFLEFLIKKMKIIQIIEDKINNTTDFFTIVSGNEDVSKILENMKRIIKDYKNFVRKLIWAIWINTIVIYNRENNRENNHTEDDNWLIDVYTDEEILDGLSITDDINEGIIWETFISYIELLITEKK